MVSNKQFTRFLEFIKLKTPKGNKNFALYINNDNYEFHKLIVYLCEYLKTEWKLYI